MSAAEPVTAPASAPDSTVCLELPELLYLLYYAPVGRHRQDWGRDVWRFVYVWFGTPFTIAEVKHGLNLGEDSMRAVRVFVRKLERRGVLRRNGVRYEWRPLYEWRVAGCYTRILQRILRRLLCAL